MIPWISVLIFIAYLDVRICFRIIWQVKNICKNIPKPQKPDLNQKKG